MGRPEASDVTPRSTPVIRLKDAMVALEKDWEATFKKYRAARLKLDLAVAAITALGDNLSRFTRSALQPA